MHDCPGCRCKVCCHKAESDRRHDAAEVDEALILRGLALDPLVYGPSKRRLVSYDVVCADRDVLVELPRRGALADRQPWMPKRRAA